MKSSLIDRKRIDIRDGGWLLYDRAFLVASEADSLFAHMRESIPWKQEVSPGRKFPRLTAWHADEGVTYSYSGVTHQAVRWTPELLAVKARAEEAVGTTWNSLLLN